jgi:hypothetical protein
VKLDDGLRGVTRLGIDTAPLIYLVESHPRYQPLVLEVVKRMEAGRLEGITSVVTLGEVLVQPIREGDVLLQRRFMNALLRGTGFRTRPVYAPAATLAAQLRATYRMHLPDACQIAVAMLEGC